jgi:cytoskeletal protein CcmA (bactofilin family)
VRTTDAVRKAGDWTTLPEDLRIHGRFRVPGSLLLVKAGVDADVGTTLPVPEAEALARAIADGGYQVTVETRLHPNVTPTRRWTSLRIGPRIDLELDRGSFAVQEDLELAPGVRLFVDAEVEGHARVGESAHLEGDLTAREATLAATARVRGRVRCQGTLALDARARVEGGADVGSLRLGAGATVQGRVLARDAVILPHARREPALSRTVLSDDLRVDGVMDVGGPVVLRPASREGRRVPVLDAAPPGTLRVAGDVRIERGARVTFRIEADGDIDVEDGCVAFAPLVARGNLRIHGHARIAGEAPALPREMLHGRIEAALDRALDS